MTDIVKRTHPGTILKHNLEALEMSSKEFSYRTGISERTISDLINLKGSITFDVAEKLSDFFGNDIRFWANLQTQYSQYVLLKNYQNEIEQDYRRIKPYIEYLQNILYIEESDDKETVVQKVRTTIRVNKLSLLDEKNSFTSLKEFHSSKPVHTFERNLWLSLSLTLARNNSVKKYNKNKLETYFKEIRSMTVQNPKVFYPKLKEILGDCGVSFVLMPYLPRSNIYGATKWLNENSVMLSLSNRGGKADSFWFAFFHELAHVTFEHKRYMLFTCEGDNDKEADDFAKNVLINKNDWQSFIYEQNFSVSSIKRFADEIGILPEIVLGRLEKEEYVKYGTLRDKFNVKYKIEY